MSAITWRNVNAPSFEGVNKLTASANKQIQSNIGKFTDTVGSYVKEDKAKNDEAIAGFISNLDSEDAFNTAMQDGSLSEEGLQQIAGGSNYDAKAARLLSENQLGVIRDRTTAEFNAQKIATAQNDAPKLQAFKSQLLAAGSDQNKLNELKTNVSGLGFINANPALEAVNKSISSAVSTGQATEDRAQKVLDRERKNLDYQSRSDRDQKTLDAIIAEKQLAVFDEENPSVSRVNPNSPEEISANAAFDRQLIESGEGDSNDILDEVNLRRKSGYKFKNSSGKVKNIPYPAQILSAAFDTVQGSQFLPSVFDANVGDYKTALDALMKSYVQGTENTSGKLDRAFAAKLLKQK